MPSIKINIDCLVKSFQQLKIPINFIEFPDNFAVKLTLDQTTCNFLPQVYNKLMISPFFSKNGNLIRC